MSSSASPFAIAVTLRIRAGAEPQAARVLGELHRHTRQEPGNLIYNAHQSLEDPRQFFLYELYVDAAALEAHRASPHFRELATGVLYPLVEERAITAYGPVAVAE